MEEDSIRKAEIKPQRVVRLRTMVVVTLLVTVSLMAIAVAGMLAAFWLSNSKSDKPTVETQRQTVVQEGEIVADVAQRVGKSVVSITTNRRAASYYGSSVTRGAGTGIIISSDGLILTNKHVVPEGSGSISVTTHDGEVYSSVKVIGRDPLNDIAIIKVENPKNFIAAKLADSDKVRPGQKVIAIGNALGQYQNTITTGIISGIGRPVAASDQNGGSVEQLTNLFQTDAAINSGNSGGPLINFSGEVIGVNTAVATDAQGIGFAIPINDTKGVIDSAKSTGRVSRPFIGVRYLTITPEVVNQQRLNMREGAYIVDESNAVVAGSPAAKAGLKPGDIITQINDDKLTATKTLTSVIGRYKVGDSIEVTYVRDGKTGKVTVKLEEAS